MAGQLEDWGSVSSLPSVEEAPGLHPSTTLPGVVIPVLGKWRKKDQEFKVVFYYMVSLRLRETLSKIGTCIHVSTHTYTHKEQAAGEGRDEPKAGTRVTQLAMTHRETVTGLCMVQLGAFLQLWRVSRGVQDPGARSSSTRVTHIVIGIRVAWSYTVWEAWQGRGEMS